MSLSPCTWTPEQDTFKPTKWEKRVGDFLRVSPVSGMNAHLEALAAKLLPTLLIELSPATSALLQRYELPWPLTDQQLNYTVNSPQNQP